MSHGDCSIARGRSDVRIFFGEWQLPPLLRVALLLLIGERVDAIDGAHRQTLVAATAEFGHDDHVGTVVEDGAELRRAMSQTSIAVDAFEHLDAYRRVLPLGIASAMLDSVGAGCAHRCDCRGGCVSVVRSRRHGCASIDHRLQAGIAPHDDIDEGIDDFGLEL